MYWYKDGSNVGSDTLAHTVSKADLQTEEQVQFKVTGCAGELTLQQGFCTSYDDMAKDNDKNSDDAEKRRAPYKRAKMSGDKQTAVASDKSETYTSCEEKEADTLFYCLDEDDQPVKIDVAMPPLEDEYPACFTGDGQGCPICPALVNSELSF